MRLILASNNKKKLKELREILSGFGIEVLSQSEAGIDLEVEETGTTFAENAFLKADGACKVSGEPCIADDSGLMVDALNGAPGVHTARYGGESVRTDKERYEYLLRQMEGIPQDRRGAKFVTVITLLFPDGRKVVARGECPGRILFAAAGENGFGYDPVFYSNDAGNSFALLPPEVKNSLSHRARALKALVDKIREENIL